MKNKTFLLLIPILMVLNSCTKDQPCSITANLFTGTVDDFVGNWQGSKNYFLKITASNDPTTFQYLNDSVIVYRRVVKDLNKGASFLIFYDSVTNSKLLAGNNYLDTNSVQFSNSTFAIEPKSKIIAINAGYPVRYTFIYPLFSGSIINKKMSENTPFNLDVIYGSPLNTTYNWGGFLASSFIKIN
ncbi:MAG: hypothetical protein ORN85_07900 [Sediminibacterium sp.]|nr:hypothetical protein [Sediminibacterium sp.]